MSDIVLVAVIAAIAGLISGTIATLFAPWVQWGVEKRKEKRSNQKKMIAKIRRDVLTASEKFDKFNEGIAKGDIRPQDVYPKAITYLDSLQEFDSFHAIKPYLRPETVRTLGEAELLDLEGRGSKLGSMPVPYLTLLDDLSRLEKEWDLV